MKINSLTSVNQNTSKQSFKSVYPVYHWHYKNGSYAPVFDVADAKKYQRKLLGIFNHTEHLCKKIPTAFITNIIKMISKCDIDYKKEPCALSFYNKIPGVKKAWNGNVYDIEPCAYMITGEDALFFEQHFRRPIGYSKYDAKIYNIDNNPEIKQRMSSYAVRGTDFVREKEKEFAHKNNLELHAIFKDDKLIKIGFYPQTGPENPFVKTGYYDN